MSAEERLSLQKVRDLVMDRPSAPERPPFLSAASGLVHFNDHWYVVADDELSLALFPEDPLAPGTFLPMFPGTLPSHAKERKKAKPDCEALMLIGANPLFSEPLLLAIPSGSTRNRTTGALVPLSTGALAQKTRLVDFKDLYQKLGRGMGELNIEGAALDRDELVLAQRGNSIEGKNALIKLDADEFFSELAKASSLTARTIKSSMEIDLGTVRGVPLTFTDLCPADGDGVFFLAAAEDTSNTFDDGAVLGSTIGLIDSSGKIVWQRELEISHKPEGLWVPPSAKNFHVVTDTDDPNVASTLYEGKF